MPDQIEYFGGCLNALEAKLRREKGKLVRAKIRMTMSRYLLAEDKKASRRGINSCLKWLQEGIEIIESLRSYSSKTKVADFRDDCKIMIEEYWLDKRLGDYKLKNIKNFIIFDSIKVAKKGAKVCKNDLLRG